MSISPRSQTFLHRAALLPLGIGVLIALTVVALAIRHRSSQNPPATQINQLPSVVIWAWERPEQLNSIDPTKVGVAFLAATIYLRGNEVAVRPRLQPLEVPPGTSLAAVTRIESDRLDRPELSTSQLTKTVATISRLKSLPGVVVVQIDFDATLSERSFYRQLLFGLRSTLPPTTGISMTALASWCQGDNWLDDLPVDEAVPMLFRMGIQANSIREQISSGEKFRSQKCRDSVGVSTDEPLTNLPFSKRTYVFNPRSWSQTALEELLKHHEEQPTTF
jgi:hypothetical protein